MAHKSIVAGALLALLVVAATVQTADAKRRCPRGFEDIGNKCVRVIGHG